MSTSTSRGRISKIRPFTMLPSRKSGIGFDIKSCICTIIKKSLLGRCFDSTGVGSTVSQGNSNYGDENGGHTSGFPATGQLCPITIDDRSGKGDSPSEMGRNGLAFRSGFLPENVENRVIRTHIETAK